MSLVFMGLAIAAKPNSLGSNERYDASARFAQACHGIWFYILKTVLPLDLIALNPLPRQIDWVAPPFNWSILGTLAMSVGSFLVRRRWPGLLAVWLSYLVILAPNSGIIRSSDQIAADRYSYMAMVGWVILAAGCFCGLWQTSSRARRGAMGIIALCLGALLGLVPMTWNQCRTWLNSEILWTHALAHGAGSSCEAHYNLGVVLFRQGKTAAAAAHYAEALRLNPGHYRAHSNLAVDLFRQGKLDEAAAHYAEALRLHSDLAEAHNGLGLVLSSQGKYEAALAHFAEALRLRPGYADVYNNSAMIMAACPEARYRDGKRAVESATRACELTDWKRSDSLDTLAAAYAEAGDFDAAVTWQTRAIGLLTDEREKDDFRSRLVLYLAKKPDREASPVLTPTEKRP
jgi:Tfp pilus assembly protein PilF